MSLQPQEQGLPFLTGGPLECETIAVWALCWVCISLSWFSAHWASCHFPCAGFSSHSASTVGAFTKLVCCAWPPPCGGHAKVVSARLNQSQGTIDVGECVISLVLSHHNKNLKWQTSITALRQTVSQHLDRSVVQLCVTAQFNLENKGKYILEVWEHADPKDVLAFGAMRSVLKLGQLYC